MRRVVINSFSIFSKEKKKTSGLTINSKINQNNEPWGNSYALKLYPFK